VLGRTGAGKSTFINKFFKLEASHRAKEGIGDPVTRGAEEYKLPDSPISQCESNSEVHSPEKFSAELSLWEGNCAFVVAVRSASLTALPQRQFLMS